MDDLRKQIESGEISQTKRLQRHFISSEKC
jgi:hypothetical protein